VNSGAIDRDRRSGDIGSEAITVVADRRFGKSQSLRHLAECQEPVVVPVIGG
jgi:hypothetical protein